MSCLMLPKRQLTQGQRRRSCSSHWARRWTRRCSSGSKHHSQTNPRTLLQGQQMCSQTQQQQELLLVQQMRMGMPQVLRLQQRQPGMGSQTVLTSRIKQLRLLLRC